MNASSSASEPSRTCSLKSNAFYVLHHIIKDTFTTLGYIASRFTLSWNSRTALLCCALQLRVLARLLVGNYMKLGVFCLTEL